MPESDKPTDAEATDQDSGRTRRRLVIVGAGQTGRALARALSDNWDIAVLDNDQERLERLKHELPDRNVRSFATDGTSLMNLKEAGVDGAEWLAAVTNKDEVNAEACRVASSLPNPPLTIALVRRPEHEEWFKGAGTELVSRPQAVAGLIKNRVERAHQVASGVGLGVGEILEIPVLRSSPAVDARVKDLRARRWLVAAIYRKDKYVVPHGYVVIRKGDRLLLTGDPEILPYIADYLREGVAQFPLQFGSRTVAYAPSAQPTAYWDELAYVVDHTRTRVTRALTPKTAPPPELELARGQLETQTINATDSLMSVVRRDLPGLDCGLLVLPKENANVWARIGLSRPAFAEVLDALAFPILLVAGSQPYRRILLPVLDPDASVLAAELAIDLSRQLSVDISAVMVAPPTFIVGKESVDDQKEALKTVMEVGSLYHIKIEQIVREGNPAKEIANLAGAGDLIVISHRAGQRTSFFNPDAALQIITRAPCSVLALSHRERVHGAG